MCIIKSLKRFIAANFARRNMIQLEVEFTGDMARGCSRAPFISLETAQRTRPLQEENAEPGKNLLNHASRFSFLIIMKFLWSRLWVYLQIIKLWFLRHFLSESAKLLVVRIICDPSLLNWAVEYWFGTISWHRYYWFFYLFYVFDYFLIYYYYYFIC